MHKGVKMKSIFKTKKVLGLLGATFLAVAGCTSEDVNYDIPVNSNELVDQNVVYKSETVAVEVEEKPEINSTEITKTDDKVVDEKSSDAVVANDAKTTPADSIDVEKEVAQAKKEAEERAKLMSENEPSDKGENVIVPPPAYSDETVNFTNNSYSEAVKEDDEFARAVAEAESRRGGAVSTLSTVRVSKDVKTAEPATRKSYKLDVKDLPVEEKERNITFLSTVIYHSNARADVSARDERVLKNVANFAKKHNAIIRVVGNSSSRSKNMKEAQNKIANFDLSILRAQKVRDILIKYGVPSDKVFISAVSDTEKISEENMPINEAVNRRTEVYINY